MVTLVDTSALYAHLDSADANHERATATLLELLDAGERLVTHNYVLVETAALVQRRLGVEATRILHDDVLPVIDTIWIDEPTHRLAITAMIGAGRRGISLVDWTSFVVMRQHRLDRAFAFDTDFTTQGLEVVPGGA